jgi:hypothetical protein
MSEGANKLEHRKYPTCKDCKWWNNREGWIEGMRYCSVLTYALKDYTESVIENIPKPEKAFVPFAHHEAYDPEGFLTAPDFGCIHWERKEK